MVEGTVFSVAQPDGVADGGQVALQLVHLGAVPVLARADHLACVVGGGGRGGAEVVQPVPRDLDLTHPVVDAVVIGLLGVMQLSKGLSALPPYGDAVMRAAA
jgi:hypothetical protein